MRARVGRGRTSRRTIPVYVPCMSYSPKRWVFPVLPGRRLRPALAVARVDRQPPLIVAEAESRRRFPARQAYSHCRSVDEGHLPADPLVSRAQN